jgi:hypothetical protein
MVGWPSIAVSNLVPVDRLIRYANSAKHILELVIVRDRDLTAALGDESATKAIR